MKTMVIFFSLMVLCLPGCHSNNFNMSNVQWAPTIEEVAREPNVKLVVFFREGEALASENGRLVPALKEIARVGEPRKIERLIEAIETGQRCCCEDDCVELWPTWMGVINKNNQGLLINLGWRHVTKRVEWRTHYSQQLYDILVEYEVIKPQN